MPPRRAPRDADTGDLFAWTPPAVRPVARFDEVQVRAANLKARIAKAVAATLKECGLGRAEVAERVSVYLGERVTESTLDAYASEAKEGHVIPMHRLVALVEVTGDRRVLQLVAEMFDATVIDQKFWPWVEVGMAATNKIEGDREYDLALRNARRKVRP